MTDGSRVGKRIILGKFYLITNNTISRPIRKLTIFFGFTTVSERFFNPSMILWAVSISGGKMI